MSFERKQKYVVIPISALDGISEYEKEQLKLIVAKLAWYRENVQKKPEVNGIFINQATHPQLYEDTYKALERELLKEKQRTCYHELEPIAKDSARPDGFVEYHCKKCGVFEII